MEGEYHRRKEKKNRNFIFGFSRRKFVVGYLIGRTLLYWSSGGIRASLHRICWIRVSCIILCPEFIYPRHI